VGSYRIVRKLAEDAAVEFFLARVVGEGASSEPVMLERLLPEPAKDMTLVESFLGSARTSAAVQHANVVRVLDSGLGKGQPCRVLEFVDGEELRSLIGAARERGGLGLRQVCFIVQQVAEGLACAQQTRAGYRGLHPSQVRICRSGEVKLVDPGGVLRNESPHPAPEQARGRPVGSRGDVFRLGLLLYELLARRPLFEASDPQVAQKIAAFDERVLAPIPGCPPSLWSVLLRAIAAEPEARYPSARVFADALRDFLVERQLGVDHLDIANLFARAFPDRRSPLEAQAGALGEELTLAPLFRADPKRRAPAGPPPVLHPVQPPPPPPEPDPEPAPAPKVTLKESVAEHEESFEPSFDARLHAWHARLIDEALGVIGGSASYATLLIRLTRSCVKRLGGDEEELTLALTAARTLALAARLEEPRRFMLPSLARVRPVVGGELPEVNQILSTVLFAGRESGPPTRSAASALLCAATFVIQVQSAEPSLAESARALSVLRRDPRLLPAALEAVTAELGVGSRTLTPLCVPCVDPSQSFT
jgi:serine/threonine-protein kinase